MNTVFLIGFMGSGKSTVGRILSEFLHISYVDTDRLVEKIHQKKIPSIFKEEGEEVFRRYETNILQSIKLGIVSTGGGIVENKQNIDWMKSNGKIIYLKTTFDEIQNRLRDDSLRPLWNKSLENRWILYQKRCPLYEQSADLIIDTDHKNPEEIAKAIKDEYLNN